jgi:hypothetical protein
VCASFKTLLCIVPDPLLSPLLPPLLLLLLGFLQALMPQIEEAFTGTLAQAQLTWLPQPLPAAVPHPQADKLETCCRCD